MNLPTEPDTFMNHTAIVANLSQVKDDIAFLGSSPSTDDIVFNLGETNIDFTNLNMDQFGEYVSLDSLRKADVTSV